MITEFELYIRHWIMTDLSKPIPLLNNLPKCPYAKTALIDQKVIFVEVNNHIIDTVAALVMEWNDSKTEVAVIHLGDITTEDLEAVIDNLNLTYTPLDFIFLDDHIENEERMGDVGFNNGRYNVIFMQRKSNLDHAAKKLEKLGYYDNWTPEYYKEVVGWRLDRT